MENRNIHTNQKKTKAKPLISVVVLTSGNRAKELRRCLESVVNSRYRNYEVLVIDNSCNPDIQFVIQQGFPQARYIRMPENTGIFGFNVGFATAAGKYILGLDDDCEISPGALAFIINSFEAQPETVGALALTMYNPTVQIYYPQDYRDRHGKTTYNFFAGAIVFRKTIFAKTGYYDKDFFCWFYEPDFVVRILNSGYTLLFEKNVIVNHYAQVVDKRAKSVFLTFRNIAWFNFKYFSYIFLPILILRNTITLAHVPLVRGVKVGLYAISGYIWGCITAIIPLKKRKKVALALQKKFLAYYIFNKQ